MAQTQKEQSRTKRATYPAQVNQMQRAWQGQGQSEGTCLHLPRSTEVRGLLLCGQRKGNVSQCAYIKPKSAVAPLER